MQLRPLGAEDRLQDRAQGDALHRLGGLELDLVGPAVDLLRCDLRDQGLVALQALPLEWRQQ